MVSLKQCKTILNQNSTEILTEEQVLDIKNLLELYARLSVEQFKNRKR